MAQGLTNAAIGHEMHLSVKTVESHVTAMFTKLPSHRRIRYPAWGRSVMA